MTYEEIVAAGIDVNAPDNQQVYRYKIEIQFTPEIDTGSIFAYFNGSGRCLGVTTDSVGPNSTVTLEPGPTVIPNGENSLYKWLKFKWDGDTVATVYPVSEYFYLIIYGEAKWLKEMYDVEMLVINHSMTDTLEDCVVRLELPEGLSLATMVNGQQTLSRSIRLDSGESKSIHWYVRGDKEGSYTVSAYLDGTLMPFEEAISYEYLSEDPINVLAGKALHMDIYIPRYAYYGDQYNVRIELTNVSGKPIYNISNTIGMIEEGRYTYYSDGTVEHEVYLSQSGPSAFKRVFNPGDKLVLETSVPILFQSKLYEYYKDQAAQSIDRIGHLLTGINEMNKALDFASSAFDILSGFSGAIDTITESVDLGMDKIESLMEMGVATKDLLELCNDGDYSSFLEKSEYLQGTGVMDEMKSFLDDPETVNMSTTEKLQNMKRILKGVSNKKEDKKTSVNVFDSLKTLVDSIPIRFVVTNVIVTTLEGSTTEIPYSIHYEENEKIQYFGVDDMGQYLYNNAILAFGEVDVPWMLRAAGAPEDPTGYRKAEEYIRMQNEQMEMISAADTTGEVEFKVWCERAEANNEYVSMNRVAARDASPFTLSVTKNDTGIYENGVLTFTGAGIIGVSPNDSQGGVVHIEANGMEVKTYYISIVDKHECSSEKWMFMLIPTEDEQGFAYKCCDFCGNLMDMKSTDLCDVHTFGSTVTDFVEEGLEFSHEECVVCGYCEYHVSDVISITGIELIPTSSYSIIEDDGILTDVAAQTSYSDFMANFEEANLRLYSYTGEEFSADSGDYIGTGFQLKAFDAEGNVIDEVTIIINGETNGDGKINTLDRMIIARYLAKWEGYAERIVDMRAADVNGDGKVNTLDRMILARYLAKWEGYDKYFS